MVKSQILMSSWSVINSIGFVLWIYLDVWVEIESGLFNEIYIIT